MRDSQCVTNIITDEQLLALALEVESHNNYELEGVSGEIIVAYAALNNPNSSNEDIYGIVSSIVNQHVLDGLVRKGLLEEHFDDEYTLTGAGKEVAKELYRRGSED